MISCGSPCSVPVMPSLNWVSRGARRSPTLPTTRYSGPVRSICELQAGQMIDREPAAFLMLSGEPHWGQLNCLTSSGTANPPVLPAHDDIVKFQRLAGIQRQALVIEDDLEGLVIGIAFQ